MLYFDASDDEFSVEMPRLNLLLRHANCFFDGAAAFATRRRIAVPFRPHRIPPLSTNVPLDMSGEIVFRDHRINKLAEV